MRVEPYEQQIYASITDMRDYYHQAEVTAEGAQSNMLPLMWKVTIGLRLVSIPPALDLLFGFSG